MSRSGRPRRTGRREIFVLLPLLAMLIVSASASVEAAYASPGPKDLALQSPTFYRPVIARVYSFNTWTLSSNETATYAGQAIASLNPSFVSGLIRLEASNSILVSPTAQMLADYNTIRGIVFTANPNAKFDIWLRPAQYSTPASLALAIQQTISQVPVDVVSFDNYDILTQEYQQTIVSTVHSFGKLVDGDINSQTFGAGSIYVKPDILTTADYNWTLGSAMSQVISYADSSGIPTMFHINNGPTPVDSFGQAEHYNWNFVWTDQQRTQFLTDMAQAQNKSGFAFMYPVFWPSGSVSPPTYWDSPHDDSMLQLMINLSGQYNADPRLPECVCVSPTLTTPVFDPAPQGTSISDIATLSGGTANAGGTISFFYSSTNTCPNAGAIQLGSAVTVSGNGNYRSGSQMFNTPGTYFLYAVYSGDSSNNGVVSACEPLFVFATRGIPEFPLGSLLMIGALLPVLLLLSKAHQRTHQAARSSSKNP